MACPWETVIKLAAQLVNVQYSIDYLTDLSEIVAPYFNGTPTQPLPFLPPLLDQQGTHRQRGNARPNTGHLLVNNNRFQDLGLDGDAVELAGSQLANLHLQLQPGNPGNPDDRGSHYSAEDIYIQVVTTLGEMMCKLAEQLAKDHNWVESADRFTQCVRLLTLALEYADNMYARIADQADLDDRQLDAIAGRVRRNAEAVGLAAGRGTEMRDHFERLAQSRKQKLMNVLTPQWQDRDSAKAKMGEDAWTHNPQPKGDFARRRAAAEKELRELEAAMTSVHEVDFSAVRTRAEALRNRA
jgi:hypothetical protein